jgi:uncharacterized small protein (DUF1192 family)
MDYLNNWLEEDNNNLYIQNDYNINNNFFFNSPPTITTTTESFLIDQQSQPQQSNLLIFNNQQQDNNNFNNNNITPTTTTNEYFTSEKSSPQSSNETYFNHSSPSSSSTSSTILTVQQQLMTTNNNNTIINNNSNNNNKKTFPNNKRKNNTNNNITKNKNDIINNPIWPEGLAKPAILGGIAPQPSLTKRKKKRKVSNNNQESDDNNNNDEEDEEVDDGYGSDSPEVLSIAVPRETLLQITSQQMSRYVKHLKETTRLTPAQEKELKREKRLVKNRESARNSRQRKLDHISELDEKIALLEAENARLREENEVLKKSNNKKRDYSTYSNNIISINEEEEQDMNNQNLEEIILPGVVGGRKVKMMGMVLLVFVLGMGLIYHTGRAVGPLGIQREVIPQVKVLRSAVPYPYVPQQDVRKLMNNDNNLQMMMTDINHQDINSITTTDLHNNHLEKEEPTRTSGIIPILDIKVSNINNNKYQQRKEWEPKNITYLLVEKSDSITRADPVQPDNKQRNSLGIIVPASSFILDYSNDIHRDEMVELLCTVSEITTFPRTSLSYPSTIIDDDN